MFFDLNSKINLQKPFAQKEIVKSSIEDGYAGVAFNYEFSGALGSQHANPLKKIDVVHLVNKDLNLMAKPDIKNKAENFKQYSRITLTVNEPAHLRQVSDSNAIIQSYDIVAVRTTNLKIFQACCLENDTIDMFSFDLNEKLPFYLKRGLVTEAIKKGIMFEICYSKAIEDMSARRMIFSNAIQIVRATKGKNIIVSSGSDDAFYHRGPYDAINLATILELPKEIAYKAVSENPLKCIQRAEFRKNFKGTITIATEDEEKKFLEKEAAMLARKKVKVQKPVPQNKESVLNQGGEPGKKMEEEEAKIEALGNVTHAESKADKENNIRLMEEENQNVVPIIQSETVTTTIVSDNDNIQITTTTTEEQVTMNLEVPGSNE